MLDVIYEIDFSILYFIQEHLRSAFTDALFPLITKLGDMGMIWILCGAVLLCFKNYRKTGIILLATLLIGVLLNETIIKEIVGRARPFTHVADMELLVHAPTSYSFPSGHSWSSISAATILFCRMNKKIGIPALILGILIAFSRLYLFVHFPTDVVVGSICGVLTAWGVLAFVRWWDKHKALKQSLNS